MELSPLTIGQLLDVHAGATVELRRRGVLRSGNNPCADYAETLVTRTFGWHQNSQSNAGFDAWTSDDPPQRIEIKARRWEMPNGSREVSALRRLETRPFDRLLGIVFSRSYGVLLALDIPIDVVRARAGWSEHTRSAKFHLRDDLVHEPGVATLTERLNAASRALLAAMV